MKTTNVLYAKLDVDFNVVDCNSLFKEMFLNKKYFVVQDYCGEELPFNILNLVPNFKDILEACEINQLRSALLLKNDCIRNDSTKKDAALMFFYVTILKTQDSVKPDLKFPICPA